MNVLNFPLHARLVVCLGLISCASLAAPQPAASGAETAVAAPALRFDAVVAPDGSGTHTSLQAAFEAVPDNGSRPYRILLKKGLHPGQVLLSKTKRQVQLVGEDLEGTVISYGLNVRESEPSTIKAFQGIGFIVLADDFSAENITFQNTSGDHGQALAVRVDSDRARFENCRMLGWQDTLRLNNGRAYLKKCYIEGRVDFIYGSATAVFEGCRIHSKNGGHVTAANTPQHQPFGFVFLDCKLTGDPAPWVGPEAKKQDPTKKPLADLGRPWRAYAAVAYLRCELGEHIKPAGWDNWGKSENEKTARFAEYKNFGPGAATDKRVSWARQLSDEEAGTYTRERILAGADGWKP